jgi:colanic acid biosynthesis glycosyl transferase WcaI
MVLAAADILIAILEPDAGSFAVPSKVLTYLCAQRPLLLAIPAENLAARTVGSAGAGIVVPPTDIAGFLQAAKRLAKDTELRKTLAENGYRYALTEFDIQKVTERFDIILRNLKNPAGCVFEDQHSSLPLKFKRERQSEI